VSDVSITPPYAGESVLERRWAAFGAHGDRVIVVAVSALLVTVTIVRAVLAARLPLTGDEAYYWEWSRRLAAGYTDHPPAVALAIAAFAWLGASPFAVRLPMILCGIGAALAGAGAASTLAQNRRAGVVALLAIALAPMANVAFAGASPDGPFALCWALSLFFAAKVHRDARAGWFVLLGIALAGALLSRLFGLALLGGVLASDPRNRRTWAACAIALVIWAPFLFWNAAHHWITFDFALLQRHEFQPSLLRPLTLYALAALAFSPGLWIAATAAALRPKFGLLAWTALPFAVFVFILAFRERVEVYWLLGPFLSLCVAIGCAAASWLDDPRRTARAWILAPAAVLTALVFTAGLAPGSVYPALRAARIDLSDGGPFELFTYPQLARDVARTVASRNAFAMTDGYGFSSVLDFYGGLTPVVIGYSPQGEEARAWFDGPAAPRAALFVDKVPLAMRDDFARQLRRACSHVSAGPTFAYAFTVDSRDAVPPRRYYTTWCDGLSRRGLALLRWQK